MNCFMQLCRLCTSDKNVSFTIHNLDFDGKYFIDKLKAIVPDIVDCSIKLPNGICTICVVQLNEAYTFIKQCSDSQITLKQQYLNEQLCRLCASNNNLSLTLNSIDSDNILMSYKLETIASEILEYNEKLSNCICSTCSVRLNKAYKFREKCFKSREIFKRYTKQQLQQNNEVIKKEIVEDGASSCLNIEENNRNFDSTCIKEEIINEEYIKQDLETDINIKVEENLELVNNTNFETVRIKEESNNDEFIELEESLELINNTNFETVFIKQECNNEENVELGLRNDTNIKVEESLESEYINLHSEIIIKEDNSDPERKTDSESYQVDGSINKNDDNNIFLNKETHIEEKSHKCEMCAKIFASSANLKRHIRSHTNERHYKCEICGKAFTTSGDLKSHIRSHTQERPYKCNICEKAFNTGGHLKVHIRTHTKERPYKCDVCEKAFADSGNLRNHFRTHTQDRPYKCEICQKAYSRNGILKLHMRVHTQERPYKCEICGKAFTHREYLKKHTRIHTKK